MPRTVLHYLGYDDDAGGIVAVVRALAGAGRFGCVLGVNAGFRSTRPLPFAVEGFSPLAGEQLGLRTFWHAQAVAAEAQRWLDAEPGRVFHGHSRAGLAVALWLARRGERRVVASVHCYGRQRWFYRWAARQLGDRLFWLSPAMKQHYGLPNASSWDQCIPGCVPAPTGPIAKAAPEINGDRHRLRLGGVGMLVRWKRWDLVLKALAAMPPELRTRTSFEHIGAPAPTDNSRRYADEFKTLTATLGLTDRVIWRGAEPSSARLLGNIDALVIASDREPFSVAMLEALAAGVSVVAADSGGATDLIQPGENGWLFRSGDASDLTRIFEKLSSEGNRKSVRIAPEAIDRFSAATVATQWMEVYDRL
jgi:glycosyltransferase involved in cell wall biosynthesis